MNPTLFALSGPLKGSTFQLTQEEVSFGREPTNSVPVSDPLLSRKHCIIKREGDNVTIRDLNSRNGVFVNGVPIKGKILQNGDQIHMGNSLFLFVVQEEIVTPVPDTPAEEEVLVAGTTTQLRIEDALYLKPEKVMVALPGATRISQDLNSLLEISMAVNSFPNSQTLKTRLLELILEALPADRVAILPSEGRRCSLERRSGSQHAFAISRSIVDQVLQKRVSILGNDIQQTIEYPDAGSAIHSLLCVPLVVRESVLGVLYLDTSDPARLFDEGHLQLVTAIASIAALALKNMQEMDWLIAENKRIQTDFQIEHDMIGESPAMHKVYQFIARTAPTDSTVLISGESGTGKELAARAIHLNSLRAVKPFVAINCAALVDTLLESELFGHEKGAFTGAIAQKKGKLEEADGGTVFLDEITEMTPALQAKLLRVLQEHEFERVGSTRSIHVDIRLITATNRNLEEAVKAGILRQDLYYRLNVVTLAMPPLRERREDIPLLASYFAAKYSKKVGRRVHGISSEARETLVHYDWPGNVRELQNVMERAVVLGLTETLLQEDLPENLLEIEHPAGVPVTRYHEGVKEAKKHLILNALEQSNGNLTEAAQLLGMHLTYLYRLIGNLNLKT